MWITWHQAAWLSVGCIAFACLSWPAVRARRAGARTASPWRVLSWVRAVLREVGIVAGLYALWQWVFTLAVTRTDGAIERAHQIYAFQQRVGLPSELGVQELTMRADWLIRFANTFYAYVHVPSLGIVIVWLFFRHRDHYPHVRNVLALSTGACLAIQTIPVAPPRFLEDLGFVDSALLFGQSVYGEGGQGLSNQLAAMPSVHIAWAVLVAAAVLAASTSRWRWWILAHPIVTLWAVVATANHWWLDGIVAAVLVAASHVVLRGLDRLVSRMRSRGTTGSGVAEVSPPPARVDAGASVPSPAPIGWHGPAGQPEPSPLAAPLDDPVSQVPGRDDGEQPKPLPVESSVPGGW